MEIIKKFKSGKIKIQHDNIVVFVKPYKFGAESGMIIRSNSRMLDKVEMEASYFLVTNKKVGCCRENGNNWEVVENF